MTLGVVGLSEFKAEIPFAAVDAVEAVLLEFGLRNWTLLEDAVSRRAWIVGVFADESEGRRQWFELKNALPETSTVEAAVRPLREQDWRDSYKAHFRPWHFDRLHWAPVWERETYRVPADHAVLWLDPGLAFGTGNHETTRLCCEGLVAFAEKFRISGSERRPRAIDVGCGSGILALSAVLLDFNGVIGFDSDPEAVRVSRENAELNGLSEKVNFFHGELPAALDKREAELVLANIQADVLLRFAADLVRAVAPGGELVLSGVLAGELEQVGAGFAGMVAGWSVAWRTSGEWASLTLARPA